MEKENILGTEKIGKLLVKFAVPGVISMVVNSIYNIVDQVFIGQNVGYLGNGATNVVLPLTMCLLALGMLVGDGGAAYMSLMLGQGKKKEASMGAMVSLLGSIVLGVLAGIVCVAWITPLCRLMGSTDAILPYAVSYGRVIAYGFPFCAICVAFTSVIRADGSPRFAMAGLLAGCVTNIVLDALFVIVFQWGVAGAAWATIAGEAVNAVMNVWYVLFRVKTVEVSRAVARSCWKKFFSVSRLGISSFLLELATIVAIILQNNALVKWGALSEYGSDIPLAAVGVTMKVFTVMMAAITGISAGAQPIYGYNYGSGRYDRVKKTYLYVIVISTIGLCVAFAVFQLWPMAIVSIFGAEDEVYNAFAVKCLKVFLFGIPVSGPQMVTGGFFQSVGKPGQASLVSLGRQIIFMIPLLILLPRLFGINGILYLGPVADLFSSALALILLKLSWKKIFRSDSAGT